MKRRRVSTYRSRGTEYPQIQLRGEWLRSLGYEPGQQIEVARHDGKLVIQSVLGKEYKEAYGASALGNAGSLKSIVSDFGVRVELVRHPTATRKIQIRGPGDVAEIFEPLQYRDREVFWSLYLDSRHYVSGAEEVGVGTLNSSLVHPREVYKGAILSNAAGLIVAHNHPSGELDPSKEDLEITERLVSAGELLGIQLLDHLILGGGRYTSLRDEGSL